MIEASSIKKHKNIFESYDRIRQKKYLKELINLDSYHLINSSFFCVVNIKQQQYDYVSKNFHACTGHDIEAMIKGGVNYYLSLIHPDDIETYIRCIRDLIAFTMGKLENEKERRKMSYTWNYRIKNSNGNYTNIIQNTTPLEFDEKEKPVIALTHYTVLDSLVKMDICATAKYLDDKEKYKTLFHKNLTCQNLLDTTSKREHDIIYLLLKGKSSNEIAKELSISIHTVNTHRKNILKKLNFTSTAQLLDYFKNCEQNILK